MIVELIYDGAIIPLVKSKAITCMKYSLTPIVIDANPKNVAVIYIQAFLILYVAFLFFTFAISISIFSIYFTSSPGGALIGT